MKLFRKSKPYSVTGLPAPKSVKWGKLQRRLAIWWHIFLKTLSPLYDWAAFLQILVFIISLYFLYSTKSDLAAQLKEIHIWLIAIPIYCALSMIRAGTKVMSEEQKEGFWLGTAFNYHEPKLVFTTKVTNANNDTPIFFTINEAIPGGSVELRIVKDGMDTNTTAIVQPKLDIGRLDSKILSIMTPHHNLSLTVTPSDKRFYLMTRKENSNTCIVRVYLLSINLR